MLFQYTPHSGIPYEKVWQHACYYYNRSYLTYEVNLMKTSKTNPKVFYAVLRKNLIKVNIDDPPKSGGNELVPIKILYESHLNSFFIDNKILDYQFLGEDKIAISTLYAIVVVDEKTQQKLIDCRTHPDHQVHLMLHPKFSLQRFPVLI